MQPKIENLIVVYNANSGIKNLVSGLVHKILSPETYNCNLCFLTYNTFTENTIWKDFRTKTNINFEFLYIDVFEARYPNNTFSYPIILSENNGKVEPFLSNKRIKSLTSVEALILEIRVKANR